MSWNNKKESVQKSPSIFPLSLILQFVQKAYYLSFKAQSQDFCQLVTFIFFNQPSFPERDAKGGKKKKIFFITYFVQGKTLQWCWAEDAEDLADSDVL